jgi:hypothetical protein
MAKPLRRQQRSWYLVSNLVMRVVSWDVRVQVGQYRRHPLSCDSIVVRPSRALGVVLARSDHTYSAYSTHIESLRECGREDEGKVSLVSLS